MLHASIMTVILPEYVFHSSHPSFVLLQMLSWAYAVLNAHAERKSILEVEYIGEEGTGLGPSLEFYALTAAELQQRTLGMWLCDDNYPDDEAREVSHITSHMTVTMLQ